MGSVNTAKGTVLSNCVSYLRTMGIVNRALMPLLTLHNRYTRYLYKPDIANYALSKLDEEVTSDEVTIDKVTRTLD